MQVVISLNLLVAAIRREERNSLWDDSKLKAAISTFGSKLQNIGDFDLQVHSSALLIRLVPLKQHLEFASTYIIQGYPAVAREFSKMGGEDFEFQARSFLNTINSFKIVDPSVVSLPCKSLKLCDLKLEPPKASQGKTDVFWLDFNMGTNRITTFCLLPPSLASQVSGGGSRGQSTWETLMIYPEYLDSLDIRLEDDLLIVRFTMTETIKDLCDWAQTISGYVIEAKIIVSELNKNFFQLKFTSSTSSSSMNANDDDDDNDDDSQEASLVGILKRLQSFRKYLNLDSTRTNTNSSVQSVHSSIVISPINVAAMRHESSTQKTSITQMTEKLKRKDAHIPRNSYQSLIACSPIVRRSVLNLPNENKENNIVNPVCDNIKLESHTVKVQESSSTEIREPLTPDNLIQKCKEHSSNFSREESYFQDSKSDKFSGTFPLDYMISYNETRDVDMDKHTPEKHRKAPLKTSPVATLKIPEPVIKDDLCVSDSESLNITELKYAQDSVFSGTCEEYVDKLSSAASSVRPLYSIFESKDKVHRVTTSKQPQIYTNEAVPDFSKISPDAFSKDNVSQEPKNLEKQTDMNLPMTKSDTPKTNHSLSVESLVTNDSLDQEFSDSPILGNASSHSQRSGSKFRTPANRSVCLPTKKLCNITASYLLDVSPDTVNCPLTPEEYTVISLPKISTEVKLKGMLKKQSVQSKTERKNEKSKVNDSLHKKFTKPSKKTILESSLESSDTSDSDYQPLRVRLEESNLTERRRSARLMNKEEEESNLPLDIQVEVDSPKLPTVVVSPPASLKPDSPVPDSQNDMKTPICSQKSVKPVSALKKRKFFTTTRSERFEREKERFNKACQLGKVNKNGGKQAKKTNKTKSQPQKSRNKNEYQKILKPTSKYVPTVKQAVNVATVSQPMPVDSDQDFDVEIVDPDGGNVYTSDEDIISSSWEPSKAYEPVKRLCIESNNTKPPPLTKLSPHIELEEICLADDHHTVASPSNNSSSAPSLFGLTPPKHLGKNIKKAKRIELVPIPILQSVDQTCNKNTGLTHDELVSKEKSSDQNCLPSNDVELKSDICMPTDLDDIPSLIIESLRNTLSRSPVRDTSSYSNVEPAGCYEPTHTDTLLQNVSVISSMVDECILAQQEQERKLRLIQKELSDLKITIQQYANK
ncbi:unnamed protein product [Trichobilharzia szidati]|nr:unnamed protein product [Trichobilharzia szidati]